jgi:hypothetical protein
MREISRTHGKCDTAATCETGPLHPQQLVLIFLVL